jgi:pimeloyl-ACP methyl ester carboxylesterase
MTARGALAAAVALAACGPARLDGFLYDPLPAPPGGYQLSRAVIPASEDMRITTPDGVVLHAVFVPSGGRRPDLTVLYFHGQSNNVGTTWPRIEMLYPLGYNILAVDPRGYGLSTGSPSEAGIDIDVRAALAALAARPDVDPARIVYYGRSLGGALAIELGSATAPLALVTESAFASIAELVRDGTYADLPRSFVADSVWDNRGKAAHIASPYLILHGTADPFVQPKYAAELAAAHAPAGPTTVIMVPGADHGNVPQVMGLDAYRAALSTFVEAAAPAP